MEITSRLFIRKETETEYRNWDTDLTEEEKREYTDHIDRGAALACGCVEE